MRAGGKFRQRLAARVAEFQQMDAVGDLVVTHHAQRHHLRLVSCGHRVSGESLLCRQTSGGFAPRTQVAHSVVAMKPTTLSCCSFLTMLASSAFGSPVTATRTL